MEKKVIVSEKSPAAIGPYSQAIEYNGIVYTSGVIGVNPATGWRNNRRTDNTGI